MFLSSMYAIIKLSETSSPQKLFDYDCVMLYKDVISKAVQKPKNSKYIKITLFLFPHKGDQLRI